MNFSAHSKDLSSPRAYRVEQFHDNKKISLRGYVASFSCYQQDNLIYHLDYQAQNNMSKQCQVFDEAQQCVLELRPVKGIGREKISFVKPEGEDLKKIGNSLVNPLGEDVAHISEHMSWTQQLGVWFFGRQCHHYHVYAADKVTLLASISHCPKQNTTGTEATKKERNLRSCWECLLKRLWPQSKKPHAFHLELHNSEAKHGLTADTLFALSVLLMQQHNVV